MEGSDSRCMGVPLVQDPNNRKNVVPHPTPGHGHNVHIFLLYNVLCHEPDLNRFWPAGPRTRKPLTGSPAAVGTECVEEPRTHARGGPAKTHQPERASDQ